MLHVIATFVFTVLLQRLLMLFIRVTMLLVQATMFVFVVQVAAAATVS